MLANIRREENKTELHPRCENCTWHRMSDWEDGYVCMKEGSKNYGLYTQYDFICGEHSAKMGSR